MRRRIAVLVAVTLVASLMGCPDEQPFRPPDVSSIRISPGQRTMALGEVTQLVAELRDENGVAFVGRQVGWTSGDDAVVQVTGDGRVTSVGLGSAQITASFQTIEGSSEITVVPAPAPGDPLLEITAAELAAFDQGRVIFELVFTPATGLGPLFNAEGCGSCHSSPAPGGNGQAISEVHASSFQDGSCDPLTDQGGPVYQQRFTQDLIDALGQGPPEPMPPEATPATRTTPDVFGFGLLDAIPEPTILAMEDPDDSDGDGISGRVNRSDDGRLGRFGRKAQVPTLNEFNARAFQVEQGITNDQFPDEGTIGGTPIPPGVDPLPEPELSAAALNILNTFVRFLAPPPRQPASPQIVAGERVFSNIGCDGCHVPTLETGPNASAALDRRRVRAYTDLLLHDMGPELADICLGQSATPSEFRTEPLMGLGLATQFLHDGRADSIEEAILFHGGEAEAARLAFQQLSAEDRDALRAFLSSL